MTGSQLRAARRRAGLSQAGLGARVGVGRQAVGRWEARRWVDVRRPVPRRMLAVLAGLGAMPPEAGDVHLAHPMAGLLAMEARRQAEWKARWEAEEAMMRALARVPCRARTRRGTACRALSEPGRRRCRFHGGRSTGPRTAEGRARIAEAQRLRWARWRAAREEGQGEDRDAGGQGAPPSDRGPGPAAP